MSACRSHKKVPLSMLCALLLGVSTLTAAAIAEADALEATDLTDPGLDAEDLAAALVSASTDGNVEIVPGSVNFIGDDRAAGAFIGGEGIIGFDDGIILSSGRVIDVVGPNSAPNTTTNFGTSGDAQLSELSGFTTYDAAVLEFDFTVPEGADSVFFTYVFGSEEYNEYVGSSYNDVFAFFVNGVNCATVSDPNDADSQLPVSINTINNGRTSVQSVNPHLYINNDPYSSDSTGETVPLEELRNTEMDGFTVPLTCEAVVSAGTNSMRMAIADASDGILDSWVLIAAESLSVTPPTPGIGEITVSTTGESSFDREHDWNVDKSVDVASIFLSADGAGDQTATWDIDVSYLGFEDLNHAVSGDITLTNTGDLDADIDSIPGAASGCVYTAGGPGHGPEPKPAAGTPWGLGVTLHVGHEVTCPYSEDVSPGDGDNVGVVTGTFADGSDFQETAAVDYEFGDPASDLHATVDVDDWSSDFGLTPFGSLDAYDDFDGVAGAEGFQYDHHFAYADYGPDNCGGSVIENTATVTSADGLERSDVATLLIEVECEAGEGEFETETAWAANGDEPGESRYTPRGNWATYVDYDGERTTTLFAGQTTPAGTVHFSAADDGWVTITVALSGSWEFADVASNLKVQDYSNAPRGNPAPGGFHHQVTCDSSSSTCTIVVPENGFYGVHVDVGMWVYG